VSGSTLPNFLIVGAQKSATRWLRTNLGKHPQVHTAAREQEFFNHQWHLGAQWYADQFDGAKGAEFVGESTPGYMMLNEAPARQAARIDGFLPDVKLIAMLRNPVDRTYSAFVHFMRSGEIGVGEDLLERLERFSIEDDPQCLVGGGLYYRSLKPYIERFGSRLLILQQDDIKRDPKGVYFTALQHIGAHTDFVPPGLEGVLFSNPTPTDSAYAVDGERRPLPAEERAKLFELFREDLLLLEEHTAVSTRRWWPR
jgi:hypothetical protein